MLTDEHDRTRFTSYTPQYKLVKYQHITTRNLLTLLCVNCLWCVDKGTMRVRKCLIMCIPTTKRLQCHVVKLVTTQTIP